MNDNGERGPGQHGPRRRRAMPPTDPTASMKHPQTDAARHAGATHVAVEAAGADGELRLTVIDNGRGFDVEAVPQGALLTLAAALALAPLELR